MATLRQTVKMLLPRPLLQKARAAVWSLGDIRHGLKTGQWNLPPAYLRVKVSGTIPPDDYIESSKKTVQDLVNMVKIAGTDPKAITSVLDFGCGCGRLISAFQAQLPQARFFGTDAEADLIEWSRKHLPNADFRVNTPEPPLPYADGQFDLIYAISVFTHLDERQQYLWLDELRRVAKPGALLILTVHGTDDENKFEFVKNDAWSDFFPDHYHTTFHGQTYIRVNWSRYFTILDYRVHAIGKQDAVVLRKPE
ncbi:MAG: class I SAM-dependent methyltransferase [Janthinobacterium lividum]